jgi:ribonuclease D
MTHILKTTEELEVFLSKLQKTKVIYLDTEFKRRDSYFPILCLIQVSVANQIALIDPTIKTISLEPLLNILSDNNILKVLHSARQDLEIFYYYNNYKPIAPIFDTQIAASFCGFGSSESYESLVAKLLNVHLDKSQRITDWAKRPFTDKQLKYAVNDVLYLPQIHAYLAKILKETKRSFWHDEEVESYQNPRSFMLPNEKLWKRINFDSKDPQKVAQLLGLINWREELAAKVDLNRGQIISDIDLYLLVFKNNRTQILACLDQKIQQEIVTILDSPQSSYLVNRAQQIIKLKLQNATSYCRILVKLILRIKAQELGISEELIAKNEDLTILCQFGRKSKYVDELKIMHGWRLTAFGKTLNEFLSGKKALRIEKGQISLH